MKIWFLLFLFFLFIDNRKKKFNPFWGFKVRFLKKNPNRPKGNKKPDYQFLALNCHGNPVSTKNRLIFPAATGLSQRFALTTPAGISLHVEAENHFIGSSWDHWLSVLRLLGVWLFRKIPFVSL
jgi:hypothetical protein